MGAIGVIDTAADAEPVLGWLDQLHVKAAFVVARQDAESCPDEGYRYMEARGHVDQLLDARKAKKTANAYIAKERHHCCMIEPAEKKIAQSAPIPRVNRMAEVACMPNQHVPLSAGIKLATSIVRVQTAQVGSPNAACDLANLPA